MKPAERFSKLPPYSPIEPFEVLSARLGRPADQITKLDANENPYGPSPLARKALAELQFAHVYPDPESRELRASLSHFTGIAESYLLAGAGADELIDLLLRVMLEPGDTVLNCPPSFGMYPFDTLLNAGQLVEVPRREDFSLNLEGIRAALRDRKPKIAFITAPNNPDGSFPTAEELQVLLDSPCLVVIDEAYIEFAQDSGLLGMRKSRIKEVPRRENLVVLRTFSKWAGLAGLRIGYGAFPAWLMPTLWKAKQPYNVNVAASSAALASLNDLNVLAGNVKKIIIERDRLLDRLSSLAFLQPYPSQANFILCKVVERDAAELKLALAQKGVLVRHYNTALLKNYIRVSVGRPQDTDVLISVLQQI
jgi:histidinol-phosphate aminotransferase